MAGSARRSGFRAGVNEVRCLAALDLVHGDAGEESDTARAVIELLRLRFSTRISTAQP